MGQVIGATEVLPLEVQLPPRKVFRGSRRVGGEAKPAAPRGERRGHSPGWVRQPGNGKVGGYGPITGLQIPAGPAAVLPVVSAHPARPVWAPLPGSPLRLRRAPVS